VELLKLTNLTQRFGGLTAVDDFALSLDEGQIYGLIGPNGSGKSTVFNCISRFYQPQSGDILFEGKDLLKCKPHDIIRIGIARTFQNLGLFENMTVMENLLVGQHIRFRSTIFKCAFNPPGLKREENSAHEAINKILDFLGLQKHKHALVANLPFGTKRLVELCRSLVSRPRLLLLDEPASGMNPSETRDLIKTLQAVRERFDVTILLVEHNMKMVMSLCENIAVMNFGRKIAEGTPDEINSSKEVIEAYLGEAVQIA
jgi:branched-chain amino acid transport system ATP-binding protein